MILILIHAFWYHQPLSLAPAIIDPCHVHPVWPQVWEVVDANYLDARSGGFDHEAWRKLKDAALARQYTSKGAVYSAVRCKAAAASPVRWSMSKAAFFCSGSSSIGMPAISLAGAPVAWQWLLVCMTEKETSLAADSRHDGPRHLRPLLPLHPAQRVWQHEEIRHQRSRPQSGNRRGVCAQNRRGRGDFVLLIVDLSLPAAKAFDITIAFVMVC